MLKNIKDLSSLIKLDNQKKTSDNVIFEVLKIIKQESELVLKEKDVFVKKNILKIKTNSNTKFVILLHLNSINKKIKDLNQGLILEL